MSQDFLRQPAELSRWLTLEPPWEASGAARVQAFVLAAELDVEAAGEPATPEAVPKEGVGQLGECTVVAGGGLERKGRSPAALAVIDAHLLQLMGRSSVRSSDAEG